MKAIVRDQYGSPDVLRLEEIEKPIPGDDEVLVRVYAASLNASDWEVLTGKPLYARLFGLLKPRSPRLGSDLAGRVEAVGKNVGEFQPGDDVFGDMLGHGLGTFAEYVSVPEAAPLVSKPASLSFEDAATLPQAGVIALQGIRDKGRVQPGQKVLINGAGGGAGTFAIQLAKSLGAEVTGVDHTKKQDFMRSLGADHVVDYTREDFAGTGQLYDLILDLAAHRSIFDYRRVLAPKGIYALVGGSMTRLLQSLSVGAWLSMTGSKTMGVLAVQPSREALISVTEFVEAGIFRPAIDRRYALSEVPEALRYFGEGNAKGKLVIVVGE